MSNRIMSVVEKDRNNPRRGGSQRGIRNHPNVGGGNLSNLPVSMGGRIRQDEDARSPGPPSYFLWSPRETVCASCNVLSISRSFRGYMDHPPFTYSSRIDLCRDEDKPYQICIIPDSDKTPAFQSLNDLVSVQKGKRNCLVAKFEKNFSISIQFRHKVQFLYFFKILKVVEKMNAKKREEEEEEEGESSKKKKTKKKKPIRGHYKEKILCNYRAMKDVGGNVVTRLSRLITEGGDDQDVGDFFEKTAEEWMPPHVNSWIKHIFVQQRGMNRVMTLFDYMEMLDERNYPEFESYFTGRDVPGNNNNNNNNEPPPTNYLTLRREIDNFERNNGRCHAALQRIFGFELIRNTLKNECDILEQRQGMFNIHFFLILRKRLEQMKTKIESGQKTLKDFTDDLVIIHRHYWSVVDCRIHILSLLLHRKPFNNLVSEKEREFIRKERKHFEEKISDVQDTVNWNEERRHILIDPSEWSGLLEKFNNELGFQLQEVSFRVKVMEEQNKLRARRIDLITERSGTKEKIEELEKGLMLLKSTIDLKEGEIEKFETKILDLVGVEGNEAKIAYLEKKVAKLTEENTQLNTQKADTDREIRKLTAIMNNETVLQQLEEDIIARIPENFRQRFYPFMRSEKRRNVIRKYFVKKLDEVSARGMSEFSVKLVISIKRNFEPKEWTKKIARMVDMIGYIPNFMKWGFIHANCQIANVGAHWFGSALVALTDRSWGEGYEELVALDCLCPLIVNYDTVFERLTDLAEEIVATNLNYQYTTTNVTGRAGLINCQEFALKLIKTLQFTPFFDVVQGYLDSMRRILSAKDGAQTAHNLRFLTVSETFTVIYQAVWEGRDGLRRFRPDQKNRIYFNSHEDVDEFYNACVRVSAQGECMDLKFPGEYSLLKAFDRAFWMSLTDDEFVGCPFTESHKKERHCKEVIKKDEEEEVEGEGEEED